MMELEEIIETQKYEFEKILKNPDSKKGLSVETIQNTLDNFTGERIENLGIPEDKINEIKERTKIAGQDGYIISALGYTENIINVLKAVPFERMLDIFKRDDPTVSANIPCFIDLVVRFYESEGKYDAVKQVHKTLPAAIKRIEKALETNHYGAGGSRTFAIESLAILKAYNQKVDCKKT
jgi:hypothetical protein